MNTFEARWLGRTGQRRKEGENVKGIQPLLAHIHVPFSVSNNHCIQAGMHTDTKSQTRCPLKAGDEEQERRTPPSGTRPTPILSLEYSLEPRTVSMSFSPLWPPALPLARTCSRVYSEVFRIDSILCKYLFQHYVKNFKTSYMFWNAMDQSTLPSKHALLSCKYMRPSRRHACCFERPSQ